MVDEQFTEIPDAKAERPRIDFTEDINLFNSIGVEFSNLFLQELEYFSVKWDKSKPNNIYGEQDKMKYHPPIRIPMNAKKDPDRRELTKYGIEDRTDVIFYASTEILRSKNIACQVGDMVNYENVMYVVNSVTLDPESYVEASYQTLSNMLFCTRQHKKAYPN